MHPDSFYNFWEPIDVCTAAKHVISESVFSHQHGHHLAWWSIDVDLDLLFSSWGLQSHGSLLVYRVLV